MGDEKKKTEFSSSEEKTLDSQVPIDFTTFVLSLSSSAAFHLGLTPHPDKDVCCENLPMAKHTLEILGMLQNKTSGNLTGEEERIISEVIYNLRMTYVQAIDRCGCSDSER